MENIDGLKDIVLEALENSSRAVPSESFIKKMEILALDTLPNVKNYSRRFVVIAAASVSLLVATNIFVLQSVERATSHVESEVEELYDLIPVKSLNYE